MKNSNSLMLTVNPFFSIRNLAYRANFSIIYEYKKRLSHVEKQMPAIIAAAEAVAIRWVEKKHVLMHYPYSNNTSSFSREFVARAGGLDNARVVKERAKIASPDDVFICSVRSWEKDGFILKDCEKSKQSGWLNIIFASKNGMPQQSVVDFLIDNGATTGDDSEAAVNNIVNITNGWIFTCELVSALTRFSVRPGILKAMVLPGSTEYNKCYQRMDGLPMLYPCDHFIKPGLLGKQYLNAMKNTINILIDKKNIVQIEKASDIAVQRLRNGHDVWVSSFTHALAGEVFYNNKSPIKPLDGVNCCENSALFRQNIKKQDLIFWFGEWTCNLPARNYLDIIKSTGADYIASYRVENEKTEDYGSKNNVFYAKAEDAVMIINQYWEFENVCVDIPFPPYKMAPVSGVYICLFYRMLDEKIAEKLFFVQPCWKSNNA
ncbi:MAG TPA: hypothetical protein PKX05_02210 [bacterium]|nr:hypothetical protein [bacterium]